MRAASAIASSSARRIRGSARVSMAVSIAKSVRSCRRQVDSDGYGMSDGRFARPLPLAKTEVDTADDGLAGHVNKIAVDGQGERQGHRPGHAMQRQPASRDIG